MKHKPRGNALAMSCIFSTVLLGVTALAVDGGLNTFTRTHLQSVADSAALAGAASLPVSQSLATQMALDYAGRNGYPLGPGNVSFPDAHTLTVHWTQPLDSTFARVLGITQFQVPVSATAGLRRLTGLGGLRPWGIPLQDFLTYDQDGAVYTLKMGSATDGYTGGGNFYPLGLDGVGGSEYRQDVISGADTQYDVGDSVSTQTGNMAGPTAQGIKQLIGTDGHSSYQAALAAGHYDCPRIVTVVLIEPDSLQVGHDTILIAGFATFFITDSHNGEVKAQFIEYASASGTTDGSHAVFGTKTLALID